MSNPEDMFPTPRTALPLTERSAFRQVPCQISQVEFVATIQHILAHLYQLHEYFIILIVSSYTTQIIEIMIYFIFS